MYGYILYFINFVKMKNSLGTALGLSLALSTASACDKPQDRVDAHELTRRADCYINIRETTYTYMTSEATDNLDIDVLTACACMNERCDELISDLNEEGCCDSDETCQDILFPCYTVGACEPLNACLAEEEE